MIVIMNFTASVTNSVKHLTLKKHYNNIKIR